MVNLSQSLVNHMSVGHIYYIKQTHIYVYPGHVGLVYMNTKRCQHCRQSDERRSPRGITAHVTVSLTLKCVSNVKYTPLFRQTEWLRSDRYIVIM